MLVTVGACVLSVGANVDDVTVGALVVSVGAALSVGVLMMWLGLCC